MQLKDMYSTEFLETLAGSVKNSLPEFKEKQFLAACLTDDWESLKLMERSDRIVYSLHEQFPVDFDQTADILRQIGPSFTGLVAVCLPNYVAKYGLDNWQISMDLLQLLTRYSSAEFAIRPFLVKYPLETSQQMLLWSKSDNTDVRRLASEGMRPRLPWGIRLKQYVVDPAPVMEILQNLIFDKTEYVQKSVANNLNDISKDHPQLVIDFAKEYWGQQTSTDWVLTRGLRTLFKQGDPVVLKLLGYDPQAADELKKIQLKSVESEVSIGESSTLHYNITSKSNYNLSIYLGYRVHYVRQNKTDSYKDFFLKKTELRSNHSLTGDVKIKWRQLSTRKIYPGLHRIDLLVNAKMVDSCKIQLNNEEY